MTAVLSRARAALARRVLIQWPDCCDHIDLNDEEATDG